MSIDIDILKAILYIQFALQTNLNFSKMITNKKQKSKTTNFETR